MLKSLKAFRILPDDATLKTKVTRDQRQDYRDELGL
jgi:hypothetical protein